MSTAFNLTPAIQVFPCPNCRETINTTARQCPFCGNAIDHAAAEKAAAETAHISRAVHDASMLKIMLGLMVPAFFLQFVPFLGLAGVVGFWLLRLAVPIMAIVWFVKYGRIQTTDPDFPRARGTALGCGVLGLGVLLVTNYHVFVH